MLALLLSAMSVQAKDIYPGETWQKADDPRDFGFDVKKLKIAESYADTIKTYAVVIVKSGVIVYE